MMGKKGYKKMLLSITRFEEADIITSSWDDNNYDNIGPGGWNPGWGWGWTNDAGKGGNN